MKPFNSVILRFVAAHIVLLVTFSAASGQTSIVTVSDSREVIIAADSKMVRSDAPALRISWCKIVQVDDLPLFFALAGVARTTDNAYSAYEIALSAFRRPGTVSEKINFFMGGILPRLTKQIDRARVDNPGFYHSKLENKTVLQIVLVGVEDGLLRLSFKDFFLQPKRGGFEIIPTGGTSPKSVGKGVYPYVFMGERDLITRFITEKPKFWEKGLDKAARELVEMEIKDRPETVGPPVDVLRITAANAEWVERKKECPDIKPYWKKKDSAKGGKPVF